MATEITYFEYHLTEDGWLPGASSDNEPPKNAPPPPTNRVETWLAREESHDVYSNLSRTWKRIWASPEWSEDELDKVRTEIGDKVAKEMPGPGKFFSYFPRKRP